MKTTKISAAVAACSLALLLTPFTYAVDAEERMDRLDANNDGRVTRSEFLDKGDRIFAAIDDDDDGKLTLSELRDWKDRGDKDTSRNNRSRFDRDDDGELSPSERLRQLDANGDDRVTKSEYAAFRKDKFAKLDKNNDDVLKERELD